ncbi:hypothetical protein C0039_15515 [Pseudohalioglobus lutimaris]|jgi:hypothetical protein|uniref:Uncharacterized protein n=1 Tax=Pseudohalioglobus lutimaris TaxID=1737061 RepID=A0A2N5WZZ4_9GAMM|nr:hypothetical protein C0039_15515 [Pseudohalioglobus lutimaris]
MLFFRKVTYCKMVYKVYSTIDGDIQIITDCHGTLGSKHERRIMLDRTTCGAKEAVAKHIDA